MISTDRFASNYLSTEASQNTCSEYFQMLIEHGSKAVQANLHDWLDETSRLGCSDDIAWMCTMFVDFEENKGDLNGGSCSDVGEMQ